MKGLRAIFTIFFCLCLSLIPAAVSAQKVTTSHGFSLFGDLMYGPDFKNYNYVNPDAPKGGTYVQAVGPFENLNPYIVGGATLAFSIYGGAAEQLMETCGDEPNSAYGLIAESITYPDDYSWCEFKIRDIARWHDGSPITVDDVLFSFETLKTQGAPTWRTDFGEIKSAEIVGSDKVRFTFTRPDRALVWRVIQLLPVFSKKYWSTREFGKATLEPWLMSGPYKITKIDVGNYMIQERVKNYWAKDLPVKKGRHNFDVIRSDVYRDQGIQYEAFMAGNVDVRNEIVLSRWMTGYNNPAVTKGHIIKKEFTPQGSTMFLCVGINVRRDRFKDRRVREALTYAYDFEWINKTMYYNKYERRKSIFQGTDLEATGIPQGAELKLLEPFRKQLDPRLFKEPFTMPKTDATQAGLRKNLRRASQLLKEAGWTTKGGKLVNSKGEEFTVDIILTADQESAFAPYVDNMKRLGINAKIVILESSAFWQKHWAYEWDMEQNGYFPHSLMPGSEFRNYWGSASADKSPSFNMNGIKNPVLDALIEKVVDAKNRPDKLAACRALDRVLLWEFYTIPIYHWPKQLTAYWDRFGIPKNLPKWTGSPFGFGDVLWIDKEKDAAVSQSRASKR